MPARVTYWTGTWDPAKEAISKEVESLRVNGRTHAPVVSFAPGQQTRVDPRSRVVTLSASHWVTLRALAAVVEPRGDVTHVFGGHISWHLLRALGRRPIILTAVVPGPRNPDLPMSGLARVVVESEAAIDDWTDAGVARDRIEVIYPGVDLDWFRPLPQPASPRFSLLFASTPSDLAELEARGLPLIVELARHRPDIDIVVPWRAWGNLDAARRAIAALHPPDNFRITFGDIPDMRELFRETWGTIACFSPGTGKACPNFILEGLAAQRPAILTPGVDIAREIARGGAGLVAERNVTAIATAVDRLRNDWFSYADCARVLAERQFDVRVFRDRYEALYEEAGAERSL